MMARQGQRPSLVRGRVPDWNRAAAEERRRLARQELAVARWRDALLASRASLQARRGDTSPGPGEGQP